MIIAWIGCIGLLYCIFVLPFTDYANEKLKDRFNNDLMYMYVAFLLMAVIGFMFQI
jgi:hypothetical protein